MTRGLYWFRNDLRLRANKLFERACQENEELICVFVHDVRQYHKTGHGLPRMGWHRRRFLKESLTELALQLRKFNLELVEIWAHPEDWIPEVVGSKSIGRVYYSLECAPEEKTIENFLRAKIPLNVSIHAQWTQFLIQPEKLPVSINAIPDVFSDFRRMIEDTGLEKLIDFSEDKYSIHQQMQIKARLIRYENSGIAQALNYHSHSQSNWWSPFSEESELVDLVNVPRGPLDKMNVMRGGETCAWDRVEQYLFKTRSIERYFETRNGLAGIFDSTLFSPWLANGSLSAASIYSQVRNFEKSYGARKDTYWVIVELMWRDFFKLMILKYGAAFFMSGGFRRKKMPPTSREKASIGIRALLSASTGEPFVNANMRELIQTGFMSNRGRQNVASYAIHHLGIPWTQVAWIFESLLVDYDVASNWGNCAYLAGVGNDPRGVRVFDVKKQQEMYDPSGSYTRLWT